MLQVIERDGTRRVVADSAEALTILRHSTSHLMALAVLHLFPGTHLGIGPATEDGFYYDFQMDHALTEEDLARIEEEHGRLFAALGAEEAGADSGREGFSADEWRLYLEALDRLHAGGEGAAGELLTGRETLEEVVRQAIRAEAHAILFYIGVKSLARSTADQESIELIILEEKRHIVELQNFRHARAALPRRGGRPGASP